MANVLYLTYDGLLEPLGQSQVWQYLNRLAPQHSICIVSFEKAEDLLDRQRMDAMHQEAARAGVKWTPLRYHKRPTALATAFDIAAGIFVGLSLVVRYRIHIIHARSYVPSVMALALKRLLGPKFIFDMRGLWADERVDGDLWPRDGKLYRAAKWFERKFLLSADRVVSLTEAAVEEIRRFPYLQKKMPAFEVITTCTDLSLFTPPENSAASAALREIRPFTLGYVGTVGVWYLFDETMKCFKLLLQAMPDARLHILNRGDHAYIRERLARHDIPPDSVRLEVRDRKGVADAMQHMDAGIFFIKPAYSKISSAPTKLGEFLGCGVPCLSNAGVGDMGTILESERVGVAMSDFSESTMKDSLHRVIELTRDPRIALRCRDVAVRRFSLDDGARAYDKIYSELSPGVA